MKSLAARIADIVSALTLVYWGMAAVLFPVTIWDAHTYNLARVRVAELGGLFGNPYWLNERQIFFPWSYDALHLPFLALGWGYGIPSFLCLLGIVQVARLLLKEHVNSEASSWGSLLIVAMPTLVYQASSPKNDLPVVFGVAVWFFSLVQHSITGNRYWLCCMAVALAFGAGAKSAGLAVAAVLSVTSLWCLRRDLRALAIYCASFGLAFVFLGSVEVYINNVFVAGRPLGAESFVTSHANGDGMRGTCANFIRYVFGNINIGFEFFGPNHLVYAWLPRAANTVLEAFGLSGMGARGDFRTGLPQFLKTGGEAGSDFGFIGTCAMVACVAALFWRGRRRNVLVAMSLSACAALLLVSATAAWMPWNARFLMLPFVLGSCVLAIQLSSPQLRWVRWPMLAVAAFSAVAAPLWSLHRTPRMMIESLTDRDKVMTVERPAVLEVLRDLRGRFNGTLTPVLLYSGTDSWTLTIFEVQTMQVTPVSRLERLGELVPVSGGYLLIQDKDLPALPGFIVETIKAYKDSSSFLLWVKPNQS